MGVHHDALQAELKMVGEDLHRLNVELKERELRAQTLERKYAVLKSKSGGTGEDGEEKTQAYYVIQAAQELEELQLEGDQLDAKIKKAEKEVRALEKTLHKLGAVNTAFRGSFRHADDAGVAQQKEELRARLDRAYDKMKVR